MYSLKNKQALVTGGTSGIGRAVAENFVASGANVVITGRRDSGAAIAAEIGARFLPCDTTIEDEVATCLTTAASENGALDILVINAGIAVDEGSIESLDAGLMKQVMDTNFAGAFYTLKHAAKYLNAGASVIATGSAAGSGITHAGAGVYAASKAAVAYLIRTGSIELADRGIRVNAVCPALIADTGMMGPDDGGAEATMLGRLTALGRMGRLDEVVGAFNFLAGEGSTFITGQEIRVDGGLTAGIGNPLMDAAAS